VTTLYPTLFIKVHLANEFGYFLGVDVGWKKWKYIINHSQSSYPIARWDLTRRKDIQNKQEEAKA
jgi:hypothetical protein